MCLQVTESLWGFAAPKWKVVEVQRKPKAGQSTKCILYNDSSEFCSVLFVTLFYIILIHILI